MIFDIIKYNEHDIAVTLVVFLQIFKRYHSRNRLTTIYHTIHVYANLYKIVDGYLG